MTQTLSTALSAAITFKVQREVLKNLRAALVYADEAYADQGSFSPGADTLTFITVPDIAINTTPLTEGTTPTARALTISTVSLSTTQYGDLVEITDLAKVKAPFEIVQIASERVTRQAKESLDQVARDVIAASGTTAYHSGVALATRSDVASGDILAASELRRLRTKMVKAKIPTFSDGFYRLFMHPYAVYDLRTDTATGSFIDVNKYASPEVLLKGEVGRMEGFRILEVNNAPTFASTTTVYRTVAVGAIKGWGAGSLQTLQTYHVAPGGDHSDPIAQKELVGWKVNWGCAALSNSYYFGLEHAATNLA